VSVVFSIRGDASGRAQPPPADVRAQMQRILADPTWQASPARRDLFRFVVEEALAGRADRLKGFTIAVAVFGREDDFDPQSDPVVRVEARRLRRDLDSYYVGAGKRDPVVISIPKGGYVPQFAWREVDAAPEALAEPSRPDPARPHRLWLATALFAGALLVVLGLVAARYSGSWAGGGAPAVTDLPRGPKIAVLPFANLSGDPEEAYFAAGVTDQLVTDLARFRALFVLSVESTANYREQPGALQAQTEELGVDYLLDGSVGRDGDEFRVATRLVDARSGRILWSQTYDNELVPSKLFDVQRDISNEVSAVIGSNYGVIAQEGLTEAQRGPAVSLVAYDCVLRYYDYQRAFDRQEHAKVRDCLAHAVQLDPDYPDAWALLANIYAQEHRLRFNPRPELYDPRERSLAAAKHAVALEPRNPTAQLMLANALFDRHDVVGFAAAGERAIALNPNDPDILVHFGMRLVYAGERERGLPLVNKAIALNPEFPEWYRDPLIFYYYQMGDYERALVETQRREVSRLWRLLFRAMILGQLGRRDEAQPVIEAALALKPDVRDRLWDMARVWNVPEVDIAHIVDGLRKAGLDVRPSESPASAPRS
jgi:TolB-like protein